MCKLGSIASISVSLFLLNTQRVRLSNLRLVFSVLEGLALYENCLLAQVVLLCSATGDKLNALGDDIGSSVLSQQMDVIGCDRVVEKYKT
jgi:hypothetical protein